MNVGSLFSGIGGLDLGLERAGMHVRWQCELDPYCRAVLRKHWPDVHCYGDIHDIDEHAERVDLICGGFPCQPVSLAGKGLAQEDPRWLWPQFARVVGLLRPRFVLVENVPGLTNRGLGIVVGDLSAMGYDAEWQVVSAASVGAPHLRERLFVVAYPNGEGELQQGGSLLSKWGRTSNGGGESRAPVADPDRSTWDGARATAEEVCRSEEVERPGRCSGVRGNVQNSDGSPMESWRLGWRAPQAGSGGIWAAEPDVGRVAHGVPNRLHRLRVLGNGVVPQVAEFVGRLIMEAQCS